jgi:hypothetical protein
LKIPTDGKALYQLDFPMTFAGTSEANNFGYTK